MDNTAMFKLSYGLFVLSAKDGERDCGCIINTAIQVTNTPNRISIAVNKANFTHDLVKKTGVFNVSILDTTVPFDMFKTFGFQSGKTVDKFAGIEHGYGENGVAYLTNYAGAYLSGKVFQELDLGTHTLFLADVTDGAVLSQNPSVTYQYYMDNIKPKPQPAEKKGWRCKICGYVYEGDPLPEDFICPICKHPASDFEKIEG